VVVVDAIEVTTINNSAIQSHQQASTNDYGRIQLPNNEYDIGELNFQQDDYNNEYNIGDLKL
jgi:5-hydroxyisourate hydrolase-like protein (transthyretin family)